MSPRIFTITNRAELEAERELLPVAQHILRALTSSGVVKRFQRVESSQSLPDWILFKGSDGAGFGVRVVTEETLVSPLQRTLRFVRQTQVVVTALGGASSLPYALSLDREPPPTWKVWELTGVAGSVWCAASTPLVKVPRGGLFPLRDPRVRVKVLGVVTDAPQLGPGVEVVCKTIEVRMPELGIRGRCVCGGEGMAIEIDECNTAGEQQVPGVRLDLGEIEMRLSDLVGLRPGATINLGEVTLERCFVRLGATVLAEGRFRTANGQLLLTVDSVL